MLQRRVIAVEGVVQGVGFRPYVHRLAASNDLRGFVRNEGGRVVIDVEGDGARVDEFCRTLTLAPPPLAVIARVLVESAAPRSYDAFCISPSPRTTDRAAPDVGTASVPPDVATCGDCLAELFDPANRRFRHPFITCTACGPRFTIVRDAPYDRERTTMAEFPLCADCRREYAAPDDRRFHAEAIACAACGPMLRLLTPANQTSAPAGDALDAAIAALRAGQIVGVKSLGGYHLACDATDEGAVARLRARKRRAAKPFAVMVRDRGAAEALCELSEEESAVLESSARPVVLLARRTAPRCPVDVRVAAAVAPAGATLGLMLPATPLHHLLLAALDRPLVMTSGNRSGEPVAIDERGALEALAGIADLILAHDRPVAARCDDSVVRVAAGSLRVMRRARGYVPRTIVLARPAPLPVLAFGGHLKNTVCLAAGCSAHLSAHVGDLDAAASRAAQRDAVAATVHLAGIAPAVVAHDLHPDYGSTTAALMYVSEHDIERRVAVQHHHAHVAACVAEHGVRGPVIGVAFDGAGLGTDGAIWGGEFLVADGERFTRAGHLSYVSLPGGDAAAARPWRSAAAHLASATDGVDTDAARPDGVGDAEWSLVRQLVARPGSSPRTSSVGRLFDAAASLLGLCHIARHEGEAAIALESAADPRAARGYPVTLSPGDTWTADVADIVRGVLADRRRGRGVAEIAGAFHVAMRDLVVLGCERIREQTGLETVALSGGVFMNALLLESSRAALAARRFRVLIPREAPCNDGGLSLGQAYVAACAAEVDQCA